MTFSGHIQMSLMLQEDVRSSLSTLKLKSSLALIPWLSLRYPKSLHFFLVVPFILIFVCFTAFRSGVMPLDKIIDFDFFSLFCYLPQWKSGFLLLLFFPFLRLKKEVIFRVTLIGTSLFKRFNFMGFYYFFYP